MSTCFLPESRNFRSRSLNPRSLLEGFTTHLKDAGLPWRPIGALLAIALLVALHLSKLAPVSGNASS